MVYEEIIMLVLVFGVLMVVNGFYKIWYLINNIRSFILILCGDLVLVMIVMKYIWFFS